MTRTIIALLITLGATLSAVPQAQASCSGCDGVTPPAPTYGGSYDYKECSESCSDTPTSGSLPQQVSLTLPGLGINGTNCNSAPLDLTLTLTAGIANELKTAVEAGIKGLVGGSFEVSVTFSVGIGFECSTQVPECAWGSMKMDFGIVGTATEDVVERVIRSCCNFMEIRVNIFGWDWPVRDKRVARRCGNSASCGPQSDGGSISVRIGAQCKADGGEASAEQCPGCHESECSDDTPVCYTMGGDPTEPCCENGVLVNPLDEEEEAEDETDEGDGLSTESDDGDGSKDKGETEVYDYQVETKKK